MRHPIALVLVALVACDPLEPPVPQAFPIVGSYHLAAVNGKPLPAVVGKVGAFDIVQTGGGLTVLADSTWIVGDTTVDIVTTRFRWAGLLTARDTLNTYTLKDSSRTLLRYQASFDSMAFTLTDGAGSVYRYLRKP
jgi:hypothetical protein